jgi:hypothetical protein
MSTLDTGFSLLAPAIHVGFFQSILNWLKGDFNTVGDEIVALAKSETRSRLYPGHGLLTGLLRDSYKGTSTQNGDIVEIQFGTDVYYAPYVEFKWGGSRAHFFPAMQVVEEQIPEIIKKHVNRQLGI